MPIKEGAGEQHPPPLNLFFPEVVFRILATILKFHVYLEFPRRNTAAP